MPNVLLITDYSKAVAIFTKLQAEHEFDLQVAPTLSQGEEEIIAQPPDSPYCVFVQNRISGLSGELIGRYLRGLLPEKARVVVLAMDAAEAQEMQLASCPVVDLSLEEAVTEEAILSYVGTGKEKEGAVAEEAQPEERVVAAPRPLPARKPAPAYPAWLVAAVIGLLCLPPLAYWAGKKVGRHRAPAPAAQEAAVTTPVTSASRAPAQPPSAERGIPEKKTHRR